MTNSDKNKVELGLERLKDSDDRSPNLKPNETNKILAPLNAQFDAGQAKLQEEADKNRHDRKEELIGLMVLLTKIGLCVAFSFYALVIFVAFWNTFIPHAAWLKEDVSKALWVQIEKWTIPMATYIIGIASKYFTR